MIIIVLLAILSLIISAFFSASETALFSIGQEQVEKLKFGDKRSQKMYQLLKRGEETLTIILLGNLFVNLTVIALVTKISLVIWPDSIIALFTLSTVVLLIFGEVLPKNIAINRSVSIARLSSPLLLLLLNVFAPLISLLRVINRQLLRTNYRYLLSSPEPFITDDEHLSAINSCFEKSSALLLEELNEISRKPLKQVAIHRSKIKKVSSEIGDIELKEIVKKESWVLKGDENSHTFVTLSNGDIQESSVWLPLSKSVGDAIEIFRLQGISGILLNDEYGDFYGIITPGICLLNFDTGQDDHENQEKIFIDGADEISKYRSWFSNEMLESYPDVKSVNGLITGWLGEIPKAGTIFELELCILRIEKSENSKISQISLSRRRVE
jgi:putative hemolysin